MKSEWDDYAEKWDSDKDVNTYSELAFESLSNVVNIENRNVIDFGCGTGLLTEKIVALANHVVAIDSSAKMIDVLINKNLPGVVAIADVLSPESIANNKLSSSSFDVAVASSVFGFIPNYGSIVVLLKSLLKEQGLLIQWDWLSTKDNPAFGLSENIVEEVLVNAGFKNISVTVPFSMSGSEGTMPVLMATAQKP